MPGPGKIIFIEPDGKTITVDCAQIPYPGDPPTEIIIPQVTRSPPNAATPYDHLHVPVSADNSPPTPNDLQIKLLEPLPPHGQLGKMMLPYNGGPANTVSIKIDDGSSGDAGTPDQ